jgi:hypothetical protein
MEQSQDFATPLKAGNIMTEGVSDIPSPLSPHLVEEAERLLSGRWKEESGLTERVVEHLDNLGGAISRIARSVHKSQLENALRYQDVAGDFDKVKAWQDGANERIGRSVPIKDREFLSLWSALDFSVRSLEAEVQDCVEDLKRRNDQLVNEKMILEKTVIELKDAVVQLSKMWTKFFVIVSKMWRDSRKRWRRKCTLEVHVFRMESYLLGRQKERPMKIYLSMTRKEVKR